MIKLHKIINDKAPDTFEVSFLGNGGEEQMTVIASFGQNGKVSCMVIAVQVDGFVHILHQGVVGRGIFKILMSNACEIWLKGSTKNFTEGDFKVIAQDLLVMNEAIATKYEV